MSNAPLTEQLAYLIASANRQLEEELADRLKPEGVPVERMRILEILSVRDGVPMGELAAAVLVDGPTLTKIIDRMVSESLVFRAPDPRDRRRVLIHLAPRGRLLHERLVGIAADQQKRLLEKLAGSKAEQLKALLRDLIRD